MNSEKLQDASAMAAGSSVPVVPTIRYTWEPLRITHTKPLLTNQEVALIARPNLWHKFIIFGVESYDKEEILNAMIKSCEPETLLPVMYNRENSEKATFLARCSISAVKNLVNYGLRVVMPDGRSLGLDIVVGFVDSTELHVNPQRTINQALQARYEPAKKILNLDDFKNDKYLRHIYCAIAFQKVFNFVIRCCTVRIHGAAWECKLPIRELSLRSNGITGLSPFDKFFNYLLTKIDLRNNAIKDVKHLSYLTDFKITELWLDGNPLCSRYSTSEDYVRAVKSIFPHVQKLDGVVIGVETKFVPIMQINYIGDSSRLNLAKQFIRHFFTFYDQDDRNVMSGLYDDEALFSITLGSINNTTHLQMTKAFASNRNLLKFVDYAKCHEFLLRGPEKIVAALRRQPPTFHDYKKFNIDILYFTDDCLVIAVQGFFSYKEYPNPPLLFNRTFVIVEIGDNEYRIANDQYHIQSESSSARSVASDQKIGRTVVPKIEPTIFSPSEKKQLLMFFRERTTMNEAFSRHYLENANWDIRVALRAFVKSYTVNDVPPEAFKEFTYS